VDPGWKSRRHPEEPMNVELTAEETELLRTMLLAEIEAKRVEIHHARNIDYKAELQKQHKVLQEIAKRFG
jgi:hypothetical protein